ncbi:MAG TPA: hypothetical protein DHG49_01840 [Clostridiales bacterium]|jgi:hypothetical protein|nr:hypothetical protein [Clostridiales bacterium]
MLMQKDLKILREYYDIYIPQALRDFDDYDFIADNTFLAGIVWHVIEGKYSKFIGPGYEEYVDDDYQIAKKKILEENVGNDNYNKLIYYFKMYEATVNILTKLLS